MPKKRNSSEKRRKLSRERAAEYYMFRERRVTIRETERLPRAENNGESAIIEVHTQEVERVIEDGLSDISSGDFESEEESFITEDPIDNTSPSFVVNSTDLDEHLSAGISSDELIDLRSANDSAELFDEELDVSCEVEIYEEDD